METPTTSTAQPPATRDGSVVRRSEGFSANETTVATETAATAAAAQARALVESRYIVAMRRPRDWDDVRTRLLKDCKRPGFAKSSRYHKPVGGGIEGPSIRFAEAALRTMGNVDIGAMTIYEDREKRILRVTVTDLESNTVYFSDITIEKTVERRKADDREVIGQRKNKSNQTVYIVIATEDELLNKEGARVSKAVRNNGLRLLPGDILEECMRAVQDTVRSEVAEDPDKAKKAITDAFFNDLNVKPSDLKKLLGHAVEQCSPAELVQLREIYQSIRDGETTFTAELEEREREREAESTKTADATAGKTDELREQLRATNAAATPPTPPSPEPDCGCPDSPNDEHLPGCPKIAKATPPPKAEPAASSPKAKGRLF